MLKKLLRARPVLRGAGRAMAAYLNLVRRSNSFVMEPPEIDGYAREYLPAIFAMWHGQHFMTPFILRPGDKAAVMISRHGDGEINAAAVEALGLTTVRGSGAQRPDQVRKRGGMEALLASIATLEAGVSVAMTADVPKISRVAGRGIVKLAQKSGRPIVPVAVATSRRIDIDSWDRSSIGLPFGRGAIVFIEPFHVPEDADAEVLEAARLRVQEGLDAAYARAYELVGAKDPGAGRASVEEVRRRVAQTFGAGSA
jgi:lysophospholipid acyltransferase (LPLAT)-like uncharacterized protein